MADFAKAVAALLLNEGGYVDSPLDPGGETNFGISKRSYPHLDIKALTADAAAAIYKTDFWDKHQLSALTNDDVGTKILDMIVNMGETGGAEVIQKALTHAGIATVIDGVFGTQTLAHCNQVCGVPFLRKLRGQCSVHYALVLLKHPEMVGDVNGWMDRAAQP